MKDGKEKQPIQARSKSEYKRLSNLGADVLPPSAPSSDDKAREIGDIPVLDLLARSICSAYDKEPCDDTCKKAARYILDDGYLSVTHAAAYARHASAKQQDALDIVIGTARVMNEIAKQDTSKLADAAKKLADAAKKLSVADAGHRQGSFGISHCNSPMPVNEWAALNQGIVMVERILGGQQ